MLLRIGRVLARCRHRVALAYHLARARRELRRQGLWVASGIWCCDRCGLIAWNADAFVAHGRLHTA